MALVVKVPPESFAAWVCGGLLFRMALVTVVVYDTYWVWPTGMYAAMKLIETGPLVATPDRSSGKPSASTIVARTVMVPSLAMAALWIFTTTPVFPREVVLPFSLGFRSGLASFA